MKQKQDIKKEIDLLRKKINQLNYDYYFLHKSTVSDFEFDQTLLKLKKLEEEYPEFATKDSPTKKIFDLLDKNFKKEKHLNNPMLSLDNAFDEQDLLDFDKRIKKLLKEEKNIEYILEPKIDGLSISIYYEGGKLTKAITRGDGRVGENVTINVMQIEDIPKEIKFKENIEVRGEIYLGKKEFEQLNLSRKQNNLPLFSNPRNAASGTLRQLDYKIVKERNLKSFIYSLASLENGEHIKKTQYETICFLDELNFKTFKKEVFLFQNMNHLFERIKYFEEVKNNFNFEIDGLVIKVNNFNIFEKLGSTTKFPRGAIAYKFNALTVVTKLLDIFPTVGRTGMITYNAKLEPVNIMGSIVQRATLHNSDYINKLDLRINDDVLIKKAGEIIPKVISVYKHNGGKRWIEPKHCPSCNSLLKRIDDEVDQYCLNSNCLEKNIQSIIHFCSKDAMNIEFLAEQQIRKFIELGFIKNSLDLFELKKFKKDILNLQGYKETLVNKILSSIEMSKSNSLERLIFGLGIKNIGKKSSLDLAKKYKTLSNLFKTDLETLSNEKDFGPVKAKSIIEWIENNKKIIDVLIYNNINTKIIEKEINYSNIFTDKKVVVTGSIEGGTRKDVFEKLRSVGATVVSSISSETDILLAGKDPSNSKLNKISSDKIIRIENIDQIK